MAFCCSTAAARARATASRTRGAGAVTRTSRPPSPTSQRRPDVDPDRVGAIGLSVGGEMLIETAAETDELAAVVSDGAGARSYPRGHAPRRAAAGEVDDWRRDVGRSDRRHRRRGQPRAARRPPRPRRRRWTEPLLLIAAPNSPNGETLNRGYAKAAGENATCGSPEAGHVGGIRARPARVRAARRRLLRRGAGRRPLASGALGEAAIVEPGPPTTPTADHHGPSGPKGEDRAVQGADGPGASRELPPARPAQRGGVRQGSRRGSDGGSRHVLPGVERRLRRCSGRRGGEPPRRRPYNDGA